MIEAGLMIKYARAGVQDEPQPPPGGADEEIPLAFASLKTTGDVRARARALASRSGIVALVLAGGFLCWTQVSYGGLVSALLAAVAALALATGVKANLPGREGAWTVWVFRERIGRGDVPGPLARAEQPEGPAGPSGQVKTAR